MERPPAEVFEISAVRQLPCPTCHRKGTVNKVAGMPRSMSYRGPNGENWPQEVCRTCGGKGWVRERHG